jgi:hypothetical protein
MRRVLIVPTHQRGNAAPGAPASGVAGGCKRPFPSCHRGHGPLLPTSTAGAVGAGPARDKKVHRDSGPGSLPPCLNALIFSGMRRVLIVPTHQRGNAAPGAPASGVAGGCKRPFPSCHRGHGPFLPTSTAGAVGAGHARDKKVHRDSGPGSLPPCLNALIFSGMRRVLIVPTHQRGTAAPGAPASGVAGGRQRPCRSPIAGTARSYRRARPGR